MRVSYKKPPTIALILWKAMYVFGYLQMLLWKRPLHHQFFFSQENQERHSESINFHPSPMLLGREKNLCSAEWRLWYWRCLGKKDAICSTEAIAHSRPGGSWDFSKLDERQERKLKSVAPTFQQPSWGLKGTFPGGGHQFHENSRLRRQTAFRLCYC